MEVVNVRVKYIRPQYKDLKEWMSDPQNVYIARARIVFIDGVRWPPEHSTWANPFRVGKDGTLEDVKVKYENYIRKRITNPKIFEELLSLKDKTLGCWCAPNFCHGNILQSLIAEYSG